MPTKFEESLIELLGMKGRHIKRLEVVCELGKIPLITTEEYITDIKGNVELTDGKVSVIERNFYVIERP